jgi:hypothetical protein
MAILCTTAQYHSNTIINTADAENKINVNRDINTCDPVNSPHFLSSGTKTRCPVYMNDEGKAGAGGTAAEAKLG